MPDALADSPLNRLGVRETPDGAQLVGDIRLSLNQAANCQIWERMEHCHRTRHNVWPGHNRFTCRQARTEDELLPGQTLKKIFPYPGSADLESTLTGEIILENTDMLTIAATRAEVGVMPELLDGTNQARMAKAQAWGGVAQYYRRRHKKQRRRFLRQMADIGQEYGHSIGFVGWRERKKTVKRTITAADVQKLLATQVMQRMQGQDGSTGTPAGQAGDGSETQPGGDQLAAHADTMAGQMTDELLSNPDLTGALASLLMVYDEELSNGEAKRTARMLAKQPPGEPLDYFVATVVDAGPDLRALTPGLDVFYPADTTRIQEARLIIIPEWPSQVELEALVDDDGWDSALVEEMIEAGPGVGGNVATLLGVSSWVLSRGIVGQDLQEQEQMQMDGTSHRYQVLHVYHQAAAMDGSPAQFHTVLAVRSGTEGMVLKCEACHYDHGEYPFFDYVREDHVLCLWNSQGVGELTFPMQDEERVQANFRSDNAAFQIRPPVMVPVERKDLRLIPGLIIPMKRNPGQFGIETLKMGGDPSGSLEVESSALKRANRYWQRGTGEYIDPVCKQNRQTCMVDDWLACVEEFERLTFACIQQFASDQVKMLANDGDNTLTLIDSDTIRGEFDVTAEFDSATLDPATVKARMGFLKDYVLAMDRNGQIDPEPTLRLMMMMINPAWNKIVKPGAQAQQDDQADVLRIWGHLLDGNEDKYVVGTNHAARAQMFQQLAQQPALDDKGQPIPDPQTGQPVPGRGPRIIQQNPDVAALVQKRIEFEQFQAEQKGTNAQTGRLGVDPSQPQAQE